MMPTILFQVLRLAKVSQIWLYVLANFNSLDKFNSPRFFPITAIILEVFDRKAAAIQTSTPKCRLPAEV